MELIELYYKLLSYYGKQGWWPISHKFQPPEWEICIGAILTQNTNWNNVEKALKQLKLADCISLKKFVEIDKVQLQALIKSSGFFRQKAETLKNLTRFIANFNTFRNFTKHVEREELLKVKGIGNETADSILLYVCGKSHFVIDAYTKKLCAKLDIRIKDNPKYEDYKTFFEHNLPKDTNLYKEFHALIVRWGKAKFREMQ